MGAEQPRGAERLRRSSALETFNMSIDSHFAEKLKAVIGIHLNPPIMPWCCVAMRRVKFKCWFARSRGLPLKRGRARTMNPRLHVAGPGCQRAAFCAVLPNLAATSLSCFPAAASNTIRGARPDEPTTIARGRIACCSELRRIREQCASENLFIVETLFLG
jgi:hypothetical protein